MRDYCDTCILHPEGTCDTCAKEMLKQHMTQIAVKLREWEVLHLKGQLHLAIDNRREEDELFGNDRNHLREHEFVLHLFISMLVPAANAFDAILETDSQAEFARQLDEEDGDDL